MAKIKQGILGGFSGKVAGVVGTSWKGRAVMKSRPLSVANPRTEAQQEQRGKFSSIAELASKILTTFVQPVENPVSGDISGYNKFVKDNKGAFDAVGALVESAFGCGGGKIVNLQDVVVVAVEGTTVVNLTWSNAADLSAIRKTDKVYVAVFNEFGSLLALSSGTSTRNDEAVIVDTIDGDVLPESGNDIFVLYAAVSADGREVSVFTNAVKHKITNA